LIVHEDVREKEWKGVVEAKKMGEGSLMPKGFETLNVDDVVLVSDCSDKGRMVMTDYGGVCGLLFFAMNIQDLMRDSEVGSVKGEEEEECEVEEVGWSVEDEEVGEEQKGEWYCKRKEEEESMNFGLGGKTEALGSRKKKAEGAALRIQEETVKKFLGEHERLRYAFGPLECKVAMKNGLLKKLLVHEGVKDSLFKRVFLSKMKNESMPKEVNTEEIIVIGTTSDSNIVTSIVNNYLGVVGQLYFDIDMNDLLQQEYVSDVPKVVEKKEEKNEVPGVVVSGKGRIKYTDKVFVPRWCASSAGDPLLLEGQLSN